MIQNEIINGISIRINELFGDSYKIYDYNVEQGLDNPCFFIEIVNAMETPLLMSRRFRQTHFMITYFPSDTEENGQMYDVAETLADGLRFIELEDGSILRGYEMSYSVDYSEEVLHFEVHFDVVLIDREVIDKMGELELVQKSKE